ncbi:alpha/beta-hydrolase [Chloropicon primus]|uniref:Alpha/beta-hydrolase n=2 Tax=Chloropicon primus TaxID=1764295 RepID=A0A5B8MYL6_9CHLO|nr:alpha/beta-hydrolase [Chloropicon primus]UPR04352.1 alpha/beta-hydrolase [Chloropicon primus]|eukprot:QDZ25146.1 alpha/beta-hydrolase [Chloropicon primus]
MSRGGGGGARRGEGTEYASDVDLILELGENLLHEEEDEEAGLSWGEEEGGATAEEEKLLEVGEAFGGRTGGRRERAEAYVRKSRRRNNAGKVAPALESTKRLAAGLIVGPLAAFVGAIAGLALAPALLLSHRRRIWGHLEGNCCVRGLSRKANHVAVVHVAQVLRILFFCAVFALVLCSSSVLGLVAGAAAGLLFPILTALYGPGAPDHLWETRRRSRDRIDKAEALHQHRFFVEAMNSDRVFCASEVFERQRWDPSRSKYDAYSLFVRFLTPKTMSPSEFRGILVFHHGLHCHGGTAACMELGLYFAKAGFAVALPDALGHGQSDGDFAIITSFYELAEDLAFLAHRCCEKFPSLPLFLMGESMGGLLALLAGSSGDLEGKLAGVVATCPAFLIHRPRETTVDAIVDSLPLEFMAQSFPKLPVDKGVVGICYPEDEDLRDKAIAEEKSDGLLYTDWMKLATAVTFKNSLLSFAGRDAFLGKISQLDAPLLVQHGTADRCVDVRGSRHIVKTLLSSQRIPVDFIEYGGKCHSLLTEDDGTRRDYLENTISWIDQKLNKT